MTLQRKTGRAPNPRMWNGSPFRVMAYDPGGTTGWSYCEYFPPLGEFVWFQGQIGPHEHHEELWEHLNTWVFGTCPTPPAPPLQIVCESFEFRQHINKDHAKVGVELISKEYIGVIKLFQAQNNHLPAPVFQTASAAKTLLPDKGPQANVKLRKLGLWVPGEGNAHCNDATRHLLRYMVVNMRIRSPITDKWLEDD